MPKFKFSVHALRKYEKDKWNAVTIRDAVESNKYNFELLQGKTADILYGCVDGDYIGLVLSKEKDGVVIIITGFAAPKEYWLDV